MRTSPFNPGRNSGGLSNTYAGNFTQVLMPGQLLATLCCKTPTYVSGIDIHSIAESSASLNSQLVATYSSTPLPPPAGTRKRGGKTLRFKATD